MKEFVSRLGRRLALPEAFGWPTFWISAFVYFGTTVLFDARRFGGMAAIWLIGWALGQWLLLGWVVLFRRLTRSLAKTPTQQVASTLAIGTTAGIARGYLMAVFSLATGIADQPQWSFRLGGGAIAGLVLTVSGAALVGASNEHFNVVSKLTFTQNLLLASRKNAQKDLDTTRDEIAQVARSTIAPRLEAIEKQVAKSKFVGEIKPLAVELASLLKSEVRPTVSTLAARVQKTLSAAPEAPTPPMRYLGLPARFSVSEAISPQISFGIALMMCLSTFLPLADPITTATSVVGALIAWLALWAFKLATRALPHLPLIAATLLLALIGALTTIPLSLLTQGTLSPEQNLGGLPVQSAFIMAVLVVGIGYTRVVDIDRRRYEISLEQFNAELERERAWVDTQTWVIRREWAYLLHGKVQSALTAAISRLGASETIDKATLKLVRQDIDRARKAIHEGINAPFDLGSALDEIVDSWEGVCEVEVKISDTAKATIETDKGIGRALNELVREAVSNAVRHGYAETVTIKIDLVGGVLELVATNDGRPVKKKSRASLGTEMLNELTLDWSLKNKPRGVVLVAKLATATSSSF